MPRAIADRTDRSFAAMPGNGRRAPAQTSRIQGWPDCLITALLGGLLLWPIVALLVMGYTPTGMAEESLGRRYFYSLRIVYGEHERPWVPQGQLVSLVHIAIQHGLSAVGLPPTQLFPRIDIFAFTASAVTIILTVVAFVWAVQPLNDYVGKLLTALLLLVVVYDPATTRGYHLVTTDYYAWVHPIALVGVGAMLRIANLGTTLDSRSGLLLGAYAAVAVAIKPTYLIFVLPPALLTLSFAVRRRAWLPLVAGGLTALVVALFGAGAAHLAYYGGDVGAATNHIEALAGYVEVIGASESLASWLGMALGRWRFGETLSSSVVLVPVLVVSLVLLPGRVVSLSLLPGAGMAVYVAWRRYYPNTLIETNDYLFFAIVVWGSLVLVPALRSWIGKQGVKLRWTARSRQAVLPIAGLALALVLGVRTTEQAAGGVGDILTSFGASTHGSRALAEHLAARSGDVAFLIPDNRFRPLTVDSGIYKGGTNERSAHWGDSPFVHALFPNRYYFVGRVDRAVDPDVSDFSRIVFVRQPEEIGDAEAARRLHDYFGITLRAYHCDFRADIIYQEILSCERRTTTLPTATRQRARFVPQGVTVPESAGAPEATGGQFGPGLVATDRPAGSGLQLWRVQEDGALVSVEGEDGARVWIDQLGAWDRARGDLAGIEATYREGDWRLDTSALTASNANPSFARAGSRRQPLLGWQLEPRNAPPVVERLSDEQGRFVRIRPATAGTTIEVYSRAPLSTLDDTPVSVRAVVRVHGPRPVRLAIADVTAPEGQTETRFASTTPTSTWQTLSVWLRQARFPNDRDSFSIQLTDATEESWMDLREVSVYEGVVP